MAEHKKIKDGYYSITGMTTKGLSLHLPVVLYCGEFRSNATGRWCVTFAREDTGGRFTFEEDSFELGPVDWAGSPKKL